MTSPTHRMRAWCRRSTPATRLMRSAIVNAGVTSHRRVYGRSAPPASKTAAGGPAATRRSAAQLGRGGVAQLLELGDARRAGAEQAVDIAPLEEADAERLADRHRLLVVAPAEDRAGAAEAGDQLAEL